tara:strand:+ start:68 stop:763 length:696 start_codon:yes stop_codon:yes gene_type:complete
MKLAIMQPTFLPWPAYFALINYVDEFIFLDNVQFDKRSWQQRNFIISNNKKTLLTVPVISKNRFDQTINEVEIDQSSQYIKKHLKTIEMAYSKTEFYKKNIDDISKIYNNNFKYLVDLNFALIEFFLQKMKISTQINYASKLNIKEKKEKLIDAICKNRKCNEYISPEGSRTYLTELQNNNKEYKIKFYSFEYKKYKQNSDKFIEGASMLDIYFNLGDKSFAYVTENFLVK